MSIHDYTVFGLKVRSEFALPELAPDRTETPADVVIARGKIPGLKSAEAGLHVAGDALVLVVPEVARYAIRGGSSIVVEPETADVPETNVRLFLLGSAFGALLHQRGLLPLHANAVEIDGRAVAFMGASGSGKSTLAMWLCDQGFRILADDVCVVRFDANGRPLAYPGVGRLRLWKEALDASGRDSAGLTPSYAMPDQYDKYDWPLTGSQTVPGPLPLAAIYLLETGDGFAIEEITGAKAADALFSHTYRGAFVADAGTTREHWQTCAQLARTIRIAKVVRPKSFASWDEQNARLLDHVRQALAKR